MTDDCVRWGKKKRKFRPESVYETMLSQSVDVKPEPLHYPAWEIFVGSAAPDRTTARRWEKIGPSFTSMRSFPLHFHRVRLCFPFTCFFSLTNVFFGFIDFLLFQPKWMNIPAASFKYFHIYYEIFLSNFTLTQIWKNWPKRENLKRGNVCIVWFDYSAAKTCKFECERVCVAGEQNSRCSNFPFRLAGIFSREKGRDRVAREFFCVDCFSSFFSHSSNFTEITLIALSNFKDNKLQFQQFVSV